MNPALEVDEYRYTAQWVTIGNIKQVANNNNLEEVAISTECNRRSSNALLRTAHALSRAYPMST